VARAITWSSKWGFITILLMSFRSLQQTLPHLIEGIAVGVLTPTTDQPEVIAAGQAVKLQVVSDQKAN
jgi:hypothetical protein